MTCPGCAADPRPKGFRSTRKCAFPNGVFDPDNWNCAALEPLRSYRGGARLRDDMGNSGLQVIPIPPEEDELAGYVVLTFYKDRGMTSGAQIVYAGSEPQTLTLEAAQRIAARLGPGVPADDFCAAGVHDLAEQVLDARGSARQLRKAQEECGELVSVIGQYLEGRRSAEQLADEIVDVHFLCVQLRQVVGRRLFDEVQARKLRRVEERLGSGTLV